MGNAETKTTSQRVFFRSPALRWSIASLLLFLAVESLVFRMGWYDKYLEPDSSAGQVETFLSWLKRFPKTNRPEVMMIGDSRIAEGFSALAAGVATEDRIRFWNFGIGGVAPRVWYYMLRDGDPTRRRFAGIVLALDGYADEDQWDSPQNNIVDLNYAIGRLRVGDCLDFASSMKTPDYRARALRGCLLRGITLRRDVQDLLLHFRDRLRRAKETRINGLVYLDQYTGYDEDLRGLSADFLRRTIHFPPGLSRLRLDSIQATVMHVPAPQTGETTRYRKLWLGRILDLYKDSPTRIVFLELPRAPLPRPESEEEPEFLRWALKKPRVSALPSTAFRGLERPELFYDGLHLNKTGRLIFSRRIAAQVPPLIGIH